MMMAGYFNLLNQQSSNDGRNDLTDDLKSKTADVDGNQEQQGLVFTTK